MQIWTISALINVVTLGYATSRYRPLIGLGFGMLGAVLAGGLALGAEIFPQNVWVDVEKTRLARLCLWTL
jgi:hypothetical protein